MKLGMPVIVVQVSRLNDPPQPGFLQIKRPFIIYFCFLLKQILSVPSGLTVNGFQAC